MSIAGKAGKLWDEIEGPGIMLQEKSGSPVKALDQAATDAFAALNGARAIISRPGALDDAARVLGVELVNVAAQSKVSAENEEAKTSGYSLINLTGEYQFNQQLTVFSGVNNVFDRRYDEHLGGYNRAVNPDIAIGDRIPGVGRNAYVTLSMSW